MPKRKKPKKPATESTPRRPVREGQRFIGGHFAPDVAKRLKRLAVERDTSIQALLEEAVEWLLAKGR